MPQLKKSYTEVTIPFSKMSFTPDVPSSALGPNEYNLGENVEADVRGIRSVNGDELILSSIDGTPFYISGGFRNNGEFWFIVATLQGKWWGGNGQTWIDITPPSPPFDGTQYTPATNITEAWNGTVPIFNDNINPPFFLPDTGTQMISYTNTVVPQDIGSITYVDPTTQRITFKNIFNSTGSSIAGTTLTIGTLTSGTIQAGQYIKGTGVTAGTKIVSNISGSGSGSTWVVSVSQTTASTAITGAPFSTPQFPFGTKITIAGVNNFFNGLFTTVTSTEQTIDYTAAPGGAYPGSSVGTVAQAYTWNYNPNWKAVRAGFVRIYSTPNVGNILVAGNLTVTDLNDVETNYPVTVQWSQAFGQNDAPLTWQPTILNVANQLEIPLRGTVIDAFPTNGQLFLSSYWDTVVFTPMNYATTSAPILGVRLYNQGRGLLNANCWANTDEMVYGIDARDVWVFDGRTFKGLGNQRVKHWLFDQLDPANWDMVYVETNTEKNQVEIYYPDTNASVIEGKAIPNKMLSYRYDLDIWNAPRDVTVATFACESPVWTDAYLYTGLLPTTVTGMGAGAEVNILRKGTTYTIDEIVSGGTDYAIGDTLKILGTSLGGATPSEDCTITVTDVDVNGIILAATAAGTAVYTWEFNPASRTIVYAQGVEDSRLVQKDQGYYFTLSNGTPIPIVSSFRRDNIKLVKDYSTKTLVHRVLPETVNLNDNNVEIDPSVDPDLVGNVSYTVEGANSVGQTPQQVTGETISTNTDYPWVQITQNAYRVNAFEIYSPVGDDATPGTIWMCNAVTWQFTEVEDDR